MAKNTYKKRLKGRWNQGKAYKGDKVERKFAQKEIRQMIYDYPYDEISVREKLVRDAMPIIINSNPMRSPMKFRIAKGKEKWDFLKKKLLEEAKELGRANNAKQFIEKVADIAEVLEALLSHGNLSIEDVHKIQAEKRKTKGGFDQGIIWDGNK